MRRAILRAAGGILWIVSAATAQPAWEAARGVVVSGEPHASWAGVEVMRAGGSAIDAAVAVGFALAVTFPSAGNLGGGGFMLIRKPDGSEVAVDYRETAPAAAHRDLYLGPDGKVVPKLSEIGALAAAVPGSVAGLCHVQARHGRLPLARVLAPAIRLAEEGFAVTAYLAGEVQGDRKLLERFEATRRAFFEPPWKWAAGERVVQPELARTLRLISQCGRDGFHRGPTAERIAAEMERQGGIIGAEDLWRYEVKEREPVRGRYRGFELSSMPPPSSGGVALLEMLNLLEAYDLAALRDRPAERTHLVVEAMRIAFRDRAEHLGDPDFARVPAAGLVSKRYAEACRAGIGERAAPSRAMAASDPFAFEREQTTHYSVVDGEGFAVACTTTLNGSFGCGVTVDGAGFLLNNEMDDFTAAPGTPNQYGLIQSAANAVGPRKRPLSAMTPTIVSRDGQVVMVIGSPGGPTIINTVLLALIAVLDDGATIEEAVARPRFHHQWWPDRIDCEKGAFPPEVAEALRGRGHAIRVRAAIGDAHGITVDRRRALICGAADPRRGGAAAGW